MDLRRLKTIFICVLLVVNLVLGIMIYSAEGKEREIANVTRGNVERLLNRDMIFLSPSLEIPKSPEMKNIYLERMSADNEEFVAYLMQGKYSADEDGIYRNGGRSLEIRGDEFVYKNSSTEKAFEDFSSGNIEKVCRDEMEMLGIKEELYMFGGINQIENGVRAIFTMQYGNDVFFDAYISFDISKSGISISGKNLVSKLTASAQSEKFFNVNSVLLMLSKNPDFEKNKQTTIMSIKPGYYIGRNSEDFRNILAIPVWQIVTDSGNILYYDARNGDYISDRAE